MGLIEELSSIDINDIGSWTRRVKLVMAFVLCILIFFLGYYFIIKDQRVEMQQVERYIQVSDSITLINKYLTLCMRHAAGCRRHGQKS